ncbi:type II toxin-antitoxin system Phd/YefM family antitoxin [Caviibacterium pharyngocola]|uniref:Antitoxin n=1 Tax=Caviibacterium pharyngocola TaxID=28159 RepID=A0A2M8RVW4_9PAST|nr:type II toxin-antitoxin system Phd/YefM family antitoxin [Caviibacterium pharyngocola]PJG83029.1 prevent-host-death protein [Caviibacterium pharyngocola]
MIITSREFNQHLSKAQKSAMIEPVIITNRGEPAFVLMSYQEYENSKKAKPEFKSALEALTPTDPLVGEIELEIPPRSKAQRRPVEF